MVNYQRLRTYATTALVGHAINSARRQYTARMPVYRKRTWRYGARKVNMRSKKRRMMSRTPARRRRRAFSIRTQRSQVGRPVGAGASRTQLVEVDDNIQTRSLTGIGSIPLTLINNSTTLSYDSLCQGRISNRVYISGFQINMSMEVHSTVITNPPKNSPLVVNVAVVVPKNQAGVSVNNFFRGHGNETGIDFASARSGLALATLPINTDLYSILYHKRFKLWEMYQSGMRPDSAKLGSTHRKIWVPLKRMITFEDGTSGANDNAYVIYWCDYLSTPASGTSVLGALNFRYRAITYYRNIMSY